MKGGRKAAILETARSLFNQNGYNAVSMRDIADALGISVGNLTYHYRHKEDLIEAVVLEMHSHYRLAPTPVNLAELQAWFEQIQAHTRENGFYFWHYTQLSQFSPVIREIQTSTAQRHYLLLLRALQHLHGAGLLAAEAHPGHYSQLAQAILALSLYWVPFSHLDVSTSSENESISPPHTFPICAWAIIQPLLTPKGCEEYKKLRLPG